MRHFSRQARLSCALPVAIVLLVAGSAAAGESLSLRLVADAADGQLQRLDFATAALIASGVDEPRELNAWRDLYQVQRADVLAAARLADKPLAKAIHTKLHERLLTGRYRRDATDLRLALGSGDYNCLSAAALYVDCCQMAGIHSEIWLGRGHVNVRLATEPATVVEPGAVQWTGKQDDDWSEPTRRLTPLELLGKFYYNRGVEELESGRFEEGLALLEISTRLDPRDDDARGNLVAGLNNWAVARLRERRFDEAALLIERGLARDSAFAPLLANERLVRAMLGK